MLASDLAPEWRTTQWFNAPAPLSLSQLRGKVVFVTAFQMLCPGCVSQGLPQALRVREGFGEDDVAVVGRLAPLDDHEVAVVDVILDHRFAAHAQQVDVVAGGHEVRQAHVLAILQRLDLERTGPPGGGPGRAAECGPGHAEQVGEAGQGSSFRLVRG